MKIALEMLASVVVIFSISWNEPVVIDPYAIDWFTIDGGGGMASTGGEYSMSGTIGQPDASVATMSGGSYSLTGGFWFSPSPTWSLILNAAVSHKTHGTAGSFDINVLAAGAVECRQSGPTSVVVAFDQAIQQMSGTVSDVTVSSGTVGALAVNGSQLTITMSGATNVALLTIGFPGIQGMAGQTTTATLCFGVLLGDATGDKKVNVLDLLDIKSNVNLPIIAANFRMDINADGKINVLDLLATKGDLNKFITGSCP